MFGLIGRMHVVPGRRDDLVAILVQGVSPLIAGFDERFVTRPVRGHGLVAAGPVAP